MKIQLELLERRLILEALMQNEWKKVAAAAALGISRQALDLKIKKFGLSHNSPMPSLEEILGNPPADPDKIVRVSVSLPESELAALKALKRRIGRQIHRHVSTSELIRLGINLLQKREKDVSAELGGP